MNITAAILTFRDEVRLEELSHLLEQEKEVIEQWKQAGYIHEMYLRQKRNGVVILFKELDEQKALELISSLPFFPYFKPAEFLGLLK